jgi:hypothetical protein
MDRRLQLSEQGEELRKPLAGGAQPIPEPSPPRGLRLAAGGRAPRAPMSIAQPPSLPPTRGRSQPDEFATPGRPPAAFSATVQTPLLAFPGLS